MWEQMWQLGGIYRLVITSISFCTSISIWIWVASRLVLIFKLVSCNLTCCLKCCYMYCHKGSREAHLIRSLSMFIFMIVSIYCRVLLYSPVWFLSIICWCYCPSLICMKKCINKYLYHLIYPKSQCLVSPWAQWLSLFLQVREQNPWQYHQRTAEMYSFSCAICHVASCFCNICCSYWGGLVIPLLDCVPTLGGMEILCHCCWEIYYNNNMQMVWEHPIPYHWILITW